MEEITLEITNFCPNACSYCSSEAGPDKTTYLSIEDIEKFLADKKWDRINISGGEPLAHPNFYKILILAKQHVTERTGMVAVYTNAIETIMYNANVLPGVRVEANLPVTPNVDKIHILKMIPQGCEAKRPDIHYSNNWTHANCKNCGHITLRPDGKIATTPCDKWKND